jgi:ADP-ribose pyrophosphatase YjhB (NUDIX family)
MLTSMDVVQAAGGIMWRSGPRGRMLALIHTRRGIWTLPKGKLRAGEDFEDAALREVEEETGCRARLGAFAGAVTYTSRRGPKLVLYWHMTVVREGRLAPGDEVDEVAWLTPGDALRRLDRERDLRLLRDALMVDRESPRGRRAA